MWKVTEGSRRGRSRSCRPPARSVRLTVTRRTCGSHRARRFGRTLLLCSFSVGFKIACFLPVIICALKHGFFHPSTYCPGFHHGSFGCRPRPTSRVYRQPLLQSLALEGLDCRAEEGIALDLPVLSVRGLRTVSLRSARASCRCGTCTFQSDSCIPYASWILTPIDRTRRKGSLVPCRRDCRLLQNYGNGTEVPQKVKNRAAT